MKSLITYRLNAIMPLTPSMADSIYYAQLCSDGDYIQCMEVHPVNVCRFERWAEKNRGVISWRKSKS